jgi:uncharacterized protein (DUF2336 family)
MALFREVCSMTEAGDHFLEDLNDAISKGSSEGRARALWRATDILIEGNYTEDQIWIFGEVIGKLSEGIERTARAKLAKRLAHSGNAPFNVIMVLASDESIEVAGPVLQFSQRLDTGSLVETAKNKSQAHLLAISKRSSIPVVVTDELVRRGDRGVLQSVVANDGARFSDFGFLHMIKRSEGDAILAEQLGLRNEIPRHMFQQLIAKASDDVKRKLEQERPDLVDQIKDSVTEVTGALQSKFGPASNSYFAAKKAVQSKHRYGNLNESSVLEYAQAHKIEEATVGLSLMCSLPVDVVERALVHKWEMVLVLTKAIGFQWETAMALLFLGAKDHCMSERDLAEMRRQFALLDPEASRNLLIVYQSRKSAMSAQQEQRHLPQLYAVG